MLVRVSLCVMDWSDVEGTVDLLRGGMAAFAAFASANRLGEIRRAGTKHEQGTDQQVHGDGWIACFHLGDP